MARSPELAALDAFANAATRVPAYRALLKEAGIRAEEIQSPQDFRRLPVLGKHNTFQRFEIQQLCLDGALGRLGTVLTSSGHSGIFAFGLTDAAAYADTVTWVDDSLDLLFGVRSQRTLLINCLPMGVKVPTQACTLAETSVRPDMAVGLVKAFGAHFEQVIFIAEAAFLKLVLETGKRGGVDWKKLKVHVILGEEPLAENARRYFSDLLGHDPGQPEKGMVFSSMGVAELGLNLFFEVPPVAPLIALRSLAHEDPDVHEAILGAARWVPSFFTYDPRRIFVEFDETGRLILTTLDLQLRLPLVRYATGDRGALIRFPERLRPKLESKGIDWNLITAIPVVAIHGRGDGAAAGASVVYPEAVKEGIYYDFTLAEQTTANFRLVSNASAVVVRIQLSPGVAATRELEAAFRTAISRYVEAPCIVVCEPYETFRSGMLLDYERKFQYLGP